MNDTDRPYRLPLLFTCTAALAGFLYWISRLTGGPGNGGRYDVPAINSGAWFAFLVAAFFALMLGGLCLDRLGNRVEARRRRLTSESDDTRR